jgi:hypothetical protein
MPKASHLGGFDPFALLSAEGLREELRAVREVGFGGLTVFAAALFVLALTALFVSSPGPSDSDSNEGGGGGSRWPPTPPNPPPGDVPLDDAQPAPVRMRDDRRLAQRLPARQRRPAQEPARRPVPRSPTPEDATGSPKTRSRSPKTRRAFATIEQDR